MKFSDLTKKDYGKLLMLQKTNEFHKGWHNTVIKLNYIENDNCFTDVIYKPKVEDFYVPLGFYEIHKNSIIGKTYDLIDLGTVEDNPQFKL